MLPTTTSTMRSLEHACKPAAPCLLQLACMAGAGTQRAVYGVLNTTVKLCFLQHSNKVSGVMSDAGFCLLVAAEAAAYLLKTSLYSSISTAAAPAAAGNTGLAGSSAAAAAAQTSALAGSAAAVQLLPSLVIFGRMCLLYGYQLLPKVSVLVQMQRSANSMGPTSQMQLQEMYAREAPRNGVIDAMWREAPGGGSNSRFELILQACLEWLRDDTVAAQLSAAGYNLPAVQQLQALAAALKAVREGDTADAAPFEALAKPLQETGKLLSSLAVPLCCNNPVCTNISRTLEVSLVSGHSTKCSGCRVARYCDRRCQTSHWKQHKPMCQALQAGVASAAQAAEAAAQL